MPSESPHTHASLADDLEHLGVAPGDILLVHSSLRSLGWVCGGQEAVIHALTDAVGPHGTITVPTQCREQSDPARWGDPPIPEKWWDTVRRSMPPYDPDRTPTTFMGRIPELLRTWPGAMRSAHPQTSFAALGPHARELVHPHPLACRLGEQSPLGRLARTDAKVLFLGTDYSTCTAFHLAEYRVPDPPTETEGASVRDPEHGAAWVTYTDTVLQEEDFPRIGSAFEDTGAVTVGRVGRSLARLFSLAEAVDFATDWMVRNRTPGRGHTESTGPIT